MPEKTLAQIAANDPVGWSNYELRFYVTWERIAADVEREVLRRHDVAGLEKQNADLKSEIQEAEIWLARQEKELDRLRAGEAT